ncbi:alpha/beta hydrolase [Aureibacter tunicatorum]|uniref:Pimeloyl-ACP methyl ester carboxylesterase n=1 Tax=Aureibacter tunicatorum TaxID=866807 RepID=A0AAE3XS21_9BACT|nr:alpha/beta hydrolase [Aureibacter tunicatorum]MDR6240856.1 pimeloyl-ACP methyl ester carboxylesterase [Aureibacter tunicatorum]BDD06810.1 hypothetical protein AUTU_42930 [Aureibacter tunicatorum]
MRQRKIYFISGLGADERVFQFLKLKDVEINYVHWLEPGRKESLSEYSLRLLDQIDQTSEVILLGVSFGGIVAREIAKHIDIKQMVIISSVKSPREFGISLNLAKRTKMHKLVPAFLLKRMNLVTGDYFFSISRKQDSKLLKKIIKDTDEKFMVWAIDQIMAWHSEHDFSSDRLLHIHGNRDRIFPKAKIENAKWIDGGGHFMIVDRADEISEVINKYLSQ